MGACPFGLALYPAVLPISVVFSCLELLPRPMGHAAGSGALLHPGRAALVSATLWPSMLPGPVRTHAVLVRAQRDRTWSPSTAALRTGALPFVGVGEVCLSLTSAAEGPLRNRKGAGKGVWVMGHGSR